MRVSTDIEEPWSIHPAELEAIVLILFLAGVVAIAFGGC